MVDALKSLGLGLLIVGGLAAAMVALAATVALHPLAPYAILGTPVLLLVAFGLGELVREWSR